MLDHLDRQGDLVVVVAVVVAAISFFAEPVHVSVRTGSIRTGSVRVSADAWNTGVDADPLLDAPGRALR
ncbi:MAG: hypothetical protein HYX34_13510 [Actinobacteria bacterium]|nr:hypothetical protein [Actinomycetota bacterium]